MSVITTDDVRSFIWDRTAADNEIEMDLAFSPEEILQAMKSAAREYNSIPPLIGGVDANCLPGDTNMFLDAIAMFLYISRMSRMQRNDIEYDAGGVNTALEKKQIIYMREMIPFHRDRFVSAAQTEKIHRNLRSAFGRIG
jgi:hypothetical protein